MALTSEEFRRMALSSPETSGGAHINHSDFRGPGSIFTTLHYPGKGKLGAPWLNQYAA
jgi:hypothetical protein